MENKNLLLIILSVSALFVVIWGVSLLMTNPVGTGISEEAAANEGGMADIDLVAQERSGAEIDYLTPYEESPGEIDSFLVGEAAPEATPKAQAMPSDLLTDEEKAKGLADKLAIETTQEPTNPPTVVKQAPAPTKKPVKKDMTNPYLTDTRKPTATKRPEAIKPAVKKLTQYWIQAGSFNSMAKAENLSNILAEKAFFAQIQTRDIKGETWYRVRIGPYTQKAEADKFLGWIREIEGMEDSYRSETYQ